MCVREGSKNWRESVILENGAGLGEVLQSSPTAARRQEGSGLARAECKAVAWPRVTSTCCSQATLLPDPQTQQPNR